ncbi:hypothetical protein Q3G72_022327 [Acer saccharum]|nr:hypothetical protein Q3G72_022327 [Acer saccharum]
MFVGHLGELALSGASVATSFATVTGFSLLMGMASALDTLCGQSYGAKQLAIPSAVMVCLEMWSFEMMVLLSGLLPNPTLETSVLSISLNTSATVWMIAFGLGGAVSTRVSNELGAGHPEAARLASVLSGTARGCGWQKIGAFINLGSYYLVGIPTAIVLAFVLHVGGKGLWLGIICALVVQAISLFIVTIRTNWEREAKKATDRVYDSIIPVDRVS